jgi:cell growth-regulating nucleolar protein
MAHNAYVEDAAEDVEAYQDFSIPPSGVVNGIIYTDAPITAPPVAEDANVNVFDYMLDPTPNVSRINLQPQQTPAGFGGGRQLIRFDQNESNYVDESGYMVDDGMAYETPAPKAHRKKSKDSEQKKDKKRKRLHIETSPGALDLRTIDEDMTDAPPVLHSGLTGGLKSMMRPSQFPPSPDYSGGDNAETSPASSIKKKKSSKSTKSTRTDSFGNNLKALVSGTSKTKVSKKRRHSSDSKEKKSRSRSSSSKKAPKLIEYKTKSGDEKGDDSGAMVVYRPRSDLFLSLCTKGPESDRGYSVNKALKRFHRERSSSGTSLGKVMEEKELWRSLRMRRNERGEIVLFSLEE